MSIVFGSLSDRLLSKGHLKVSTAAKMFECIGLGIPAISLGLMGFFTQVTNSSDSFTNLEFRIFFTYLINSFTGSPGCNRQYHSQTIHSTENFTSMNLFKILWVITRALLFFPRLWRLLKAKKHYISVHTLALKLSIWFLPQCSSSSAYQRLTKNEISHNFQLPFSLHISNSITKPAGLDF